MAYFKVDDKLHDHRKTRRARKAPDGGRSAAAIGLWVTAASWCRSNDSDGWVPADELDRWDDDHERLAAQLVEAELWHPAEQDGEPGYLFHEWDEWQHSATYLAERRRRNADRMRTRRAAERATGDAEAATLPPLPGQPERPAPEPEPEPEPERPARKRTAPKPASDTAGDDFARFWELYPRKVGKQAAAKAWTRATKHTGVATIAAGLRNATQVWTTTQTDAKFIPHPATWLNEGRWDDERPLEGMPGQVTPGRPSVTLAQCDGTDCPDRRHEWTDGRTRFVCQGAA